MPNAVVLVDSLASTPMDMDERTADKDSLVRSHLKPGQADYACQNRSWRGILLALGASVEQRPGMVAESHSHARNGSRCMLATGSRCLRACCLRRIAPGIVPAN
jgi:hypothetical protein